MPEQTPVDTPRQLALILQEPLTAIVRIRAGREVVAALPAFRAQILASFRIADVSARRAGYSEKDVRRAMYAAVAFLDETVMRSSNAAFRDWARSPLGPEYFAGHVGGERFFDELRELLADGDSQINADLLEVYLLCLLLGYRGKFGSDREGNIRAIEERVAEKIRRIRDVSPNLSPKGMPLQKRVPLPAPGMSRRLAVAAAVAGILVIFLWFAYGVDISSAVHSLQASVWQQDRTAGCV
jgi:type VI secretion system protein ImpK